MQNKAITLPNGRDGSVGDTSELDEYLRDGWVVKMITPVPIFGAHGSGDFLIILERGE